MQLVHALHAMHGSDLPAPFCRCMQRNNAACYYSQLVRATCLAAKQIILGFLEDWCMHADAARDMLLPPLYHTRP